MNVSKDVWLERANNLQERRGKEVIKNSVQGVDDYKSHIYKGWIGKKVLDVGCGSMTIKKHLPLGCSYTGIDPFPLSEEVMNISIEQCNFEENSFETIYAFAMLDNIYDLKTAIENMKRIASKNVMILTGVEIDPDQYHTMKITEPMLNELFYGWMINYKEYLHPKILLIEYWK